MPALRTILLLALAACCAGCPSSDRQRPHVLLIAVDTLRADKLGCQGNPRGLTPSIDALAARGARFARCSAQAPWTLPSFASLFTSRPPPEHGAGGNFEGFRALPEQARTLAESLRDAGFATASITNVEFLDAKWGLQQGFERVDSTYFDDNERVRDASATTDAALRLLDSIDERPLFLFVHYFDPHATYDPPKPYRERFALEPDRASEWSFGSRQQFVQHRRGELELDPATLRRAEALYDGEIAFTDAQIGRLLEGLKARGLADSTLIVFTSDHGEEFLDHGSWEHGHSVYQELLHVPLIVAGPGVPAAVVDQPVRHLDVAPTVCELVDVALEPTYRGKSLAPVWRGGAAAPTSYAHGSFIGEPKIAWRHGDWKLLTGGRLGIELYDLAGDPTEQRNRQSDEPERLTRLIDELNAARRAMDAQAGRAVELDERDVDVLRELGYTDGR